MERIGSQNAYHQLVQYGVKIQAALHQKQSSLATSLRGESFDDVAGETQRIQQAQNASIRMETYIQSAKNKLAEVETKHSALKDIADLVVRAQTSASNALGASSDIQKFQAINHSANLMLDELESLLNHQHDKRFQFGGSQIDRAPVKIRHASFNPQKSPSTPDFKYFQGVDQARYIAVSDDRVLEDTLNAKNAAFEKAIRAIAMLSDVKANERNVAKEAFSLLKEAMSGVAKALSATGDLSASLKTSIQTNETVKFNTDKILTSLTKVDAAQVMAEMANLQVTLQASYTALAKMDKFNLLHFMR